METELRVPEEWEYLYYGDGADADKEFYYYKYIHTDNTGKDIFLRLSPGWIPFVDPRNPSKTFYNNTVLGKSTWDAPLYEDPDEIAAMKKLVETLPQTVILSVNLHGGLEITDKGEPPSFTLPEDLKVCTIDAAPPGACSIWSEKVDTYLETIINMRAVFNREFELRAFEGVCQDLGDLFREHEGLDIRPADMKAKDIDSSYKERIQYALHHEDKIYETYCYAGGSKIHHKGFQFQLADIGKEGIYRSKINILNLGYFPTLKERVPNLLNEEFFKGLKRETQTGPDGVTADAINFDLKDILRYLYKRGARNILLLDFSCSSFSSTSSREMRRLARNTRSEKSKLSIVKSSRRSLAKRSLTKRKGGKAKRNEAKRSRTRSSIIHRTPSDSIIIM